MLAPRKTLWSTPDAVIDAAMSWATPLTANDIVCDIGCGDGRVVLRWAAAVTNNATSGGPLYPKFVGVDVDETRIAAARQQLKMLKASGAIALEMDVSFHVRNALECAELIQDVTIFFLYLIPRGLRKIRPLIDDIARHHSSQPVRVFTYMAPLPDLQPLRHEQIDVPHQSNARWPLYLYSIHADARSDL